MRGKRKKNKKKLVDVCAMMLRKEVRNITIIALIEMSNGALAIFYYNKNEAYLCGGVICRDSIEHF